MFVTNARSSALKPAGCPVMTGSSVFACVVRGSRNRLDTRTGTGGDDEGDKDGDDTSECGTA